MKNVKRNSLIILFITICILIYILKDDYKTIIETLLQANIWFILITVIVYLIHFTLDQRAIYILAKQYKDNVSYKFILHLGIFTKFFNGITPLASGGQPMQVYELHKKGFTVNEGTNIVIQNYIVFQIALVFIGIMSLILNKTMHLFQELPLLKELTVIGFVINIIILFVLFLISFSKNFNRRIINFFINIASFFNKKINKEEKINKWNEFCDGYYKNAQVLLKNKGTFVKATLLQFVSLLMFYAIPFPLIYALGIETNISLIVTIAASSYIYIMGCYVPIPGATGGMEYGFFGFFGNFITGSGLTSLLILWRFITYYVPTIIGGIVFSTSPLKNISEAEINKEIKI